MYKVHIYVYTVTPSAYHERVVEVECRKRGGTNLRGGTVRSAQCDTKHAMDGSVCATAGDALRTLAISRSAKRISRARCAASRRATRMNWACKKYSLQSKRRRSALPLQGFIK